MGPLNYRLNDNTLFVKVVKKGTIPFILSAHSMRSFWGLLRNSVNIVFFRTLIWYKTQRVFMDKEKKRGLILIVIGICMPLLSLPFVTGYEQHKGIVRNLYETGIPLQKAGREMPEISPEPQAQEAKDGGSLIERFTPRMLPLRYILALGVFLVFLGILRIDKARNREN
jgi:hypothetical protein